MAKKELVGSAFEELTEEEMMDVDGGVAWVATTLPCGVAASVGAVGVSIWWYTTHH